MPSPFASFGKFESVFANIGVDEDCNLDIFEQTTNTNELVKKLVNMKLLVFRQY